jgi:hypothetical protein
VAGGAYASWTASGNGLGGAKADTGKPLIVESATTDAETPLFPGGTGHQQPVRRGAVEAGRRRTDNLGR